MFTLTHLLPPSSYYLPLLQSVFSSFIVPSASSSVRLLILHRTVRLFFSPSSPPSSFLLPFHPPPFIQSTHSAQASPLFSSVADLFHHIFQKSPFKELTSLTFLLAGSCKGIKVSGMIYLLAAAFFLP